MKKGISLISLIITIIVVIILAAIAVFTGFRAVDKANLAKFAQEVSDYEAAVQNDFYSRKTAYAISGGTLTDDQIYAEIAGNAGVDISTVVGTLSSKFEGDKCYEVSNLTNVKGWTDANKRFTGKYEKVYITNAGEVFVVPGYDSANGEEVIKYLNARVTDASGEVQPVEPEVVVDEAQNAPVLVANMVPVYHDGSVWRKADSKNATGEKWYDYAAKRWANVVTVTSGTRSKYSSASVGTEIEEADVLGYFVWIPRYAYKIIAGQQKFDIKFLKGTTNDFIDESVGEDNDYIVHPVFTNNPSAGGWSKELSGIWVAKFESSSSETVLEPDNYEYTTVKVSPGTKVVAQGTGMRSSTNRNYGRTNSATEFVTVRPNVTSWRQIDIPTIVSKSRDLASKHGINVDSHMMKNTEWGAIVYLTQSDYGNLNVWNNPYNEGEIYATSQNGYGMYSYSDTITGMVGTSKDEATNYYAEKILKTYNANGGADIGYADISTAGAVSRTYAKKYSPYDSTTGFNGSTTGNIYGVYDMAGGAWEYTAAYVNNGSAQVNSYAAGLTGKYANIYPSSTDNGTDRTGVQSSNYAESIAIKGDAVYETSANGNNNSTSSWNGDCSAFPYGVNPFFLRGGNFYHGSDSGVFAFIRDYGGGYFYTGFRVALVP